MTTTKATPYKMAESRDEVLANFQAFTGIEDIATCIGILENHKWELLSAVNSVIPQDFTTSPPQMVTPVQETNREEERRHIDPIPIDLTDDTCVVDLTNDSTHHSPQPHSSEQHPPYQRLETEETEGEGSQGDSEYGDAREMFSEEEEGGETITDDMFVADDDLTTVNTREPLIPLDCEDPCDALEHFTNQFEHRYGTLHPFFFIGSLADAVKEANGSSAAERRPMFLYLHHDNSILSNIFCSQLLCCDSIVNYLSLHYLVWAWDLTDESLKRRLLDMVRECFGNLAANSVDDVKAEHLPVILIVFKSKGQMDVRNIIQGQSDPDTLLSALIMAHDQHQEIVEYDMKEERERWAREEMKALQEEAFKESLLADKEKDRIRHQEEELKKQKELEEEMERKRREEMRLEMENSIPPEPPEGSPNVATILLRFPDGSSERRRFLSSHTVGNLLNYVGSKGYPLDEHKVLTSFPRKDVTLMDTQLSLEEVKLCPQETLFVEER